MRRDEASSKEIRRECNDIQRDRAHRSTLSGAPVSLASLWLVILCSARVGVVGNVVVVPRSNQRRCGREGLREGVGSGGSAAGGKAAAGTWGGNQRGSIRLQVCILTRERVPLPVLLQGEQLAHWPHPVPPHRLLHVRVMALLVLVDEVAQVKPEVEARAGRARVSVEVAAPIPQRSARCEPGRRAGAALAAGCARPGRGPLRSWLRASERRTPTPSVSMRRRRTRGRTVAGPPAEAGGSGPAASGHRRR